MFLAQRDEAGLYNITDHEPAPAQDVVTQAARLMGVEPPPEQAFESAEMTPMARTFYSANKRVSNRTIRQQIGRATCRARVCQYVYISVVAVSLKKKKNNKIRPPHKNK